MQTALDNISIPEALKSTNSSVFSGCNLVRVAYNAIAMTTTGVLKDMTNLTQVVFGDKVESLPGHSFYGCVNLQNVTLPDSIETIGYDAFRDCNAMTEIVLGKMSYSEDAFSGMDGGTDYLRQAIRIYVVQTVVYKLDGGVQRYDSLGLRRDAGVGQLIAGQA